MAQRRIRIMFQKIADEILHLIRHGICSDCCTDSGIGKEISRRRSVILGINRHREIVDIVQKFLILICHIRKCPCAVVDHGGLSAGKQIRHCIGVCRCPSDLIKIAHFLHKFCCLQAGLFPKGTFTGHSIFNIGIPCHPERNHREVAKRRPVAANRKRCIPFCFQLLTRLYKLVKILWFCCNTCIFKHIFMIEEVLCITLECHQPQTAVIQFCILF